MMKGKANNKFSNIPAGWEVKKLKDVFYINELALPANTPSDFQFRYIPIEKVSTNHIDYENCEQFDFQDAPGRARRIIRQNDILISGVRPNLKAFAIFKKPDDKNWICSTGFFVLTAKQPEDNLISYYELLSEICGSQFYSLVVGTNYPAIGDSDIRNIRLMLPSSKEEKTAVANILSKVDEAIVSVQNSIDAAERLKKSLMQNLLTGKMKPDGTFRTPDEFYIDEKFGKVPVGWGVKRVDALFDFYPTASYSRSMLSDSGDCKYIHYGDIHTRFETFLDISKETLPYINKDMVKKFVYIEDGDIIISDTSEDYEGVGKLVEIVNLGNSKVISGLHTLLLRPNTKELINGFKGYLFNEERVRLEFLKYVTGIKVYSISKNSMAKVLLPIPTKQEQESIKDRLDAVKNDISSSRTKIMSLERLKKSLMQNLLTGKVIMRNK